MNTILNMFSNNSDIGLLRDGGYGAADFDIAVAPLKYTIDEQGYSGTAPQRCYTSTKSVIYRTDTSEELGIHGHNYNGLQPKSCIDKARTLLERSPLDTTGITERIRTSHNGARMFIHHDLPAHTYETGDGDRASLSLLTMTSLDGTWPFVMSVAATQSACTNLQVFISGGVAIYKAKHTKSLDIDHGSNVIIKALDVFQNERELWRKWQGEKVRDMEAFKFFADALDVKLESGFTLISPVDILNDMPRRNTSLEYIWHKYKATYSKRLGNNYWAVYNAMTDWSTHFGAVRQASAANIASIQNDRQQLIRQAVNSHPFLKVA